MKKYLIVCICVIVASVVVFLSFLNLNYSRNIATINNGVIIDLINGQIISNAQLTIKGDLKRYVNSSFDGNLEFKVNNEDLSYLNSKAPISASIIPVKMKGDTKTLIYHNMGTYRPFVGWFSTNKLDKIAFAISGKDGNSTNWFYVYPANTKGEAFKILRELFKRTNYENIYDLEDWG